MGWLKAIGEAIGESVVNDMVKSGEMDRIVRRSMANEFERLAKLPEYSHIANRLRRMAIRARSENPSQDSK